DTTNVSAPRTPPSTELSACGCWAPVFPVEPRHDASERQGQSRLSLSEASGLPEIHRWPGGPGGAGYQGGRVRPGVVRLPQQNPQPGENPLLGTQRLLSVAQASAGRAFQDQARC